MIITSHLSLSFLLPRLFSSLFFLSLVVRCPLRSLLLLRAVVVVFIVLVRVVVSVVFVVVSRSVGRRLCPSRRVLAVRVSCVCWVRVFLFSRMRLWLSSCQVHSARLVACLCAGHHDDDGGCCSGNFKFFYFLALSSVSFLCLRVFFLSHLHLRFAITFFFLSSASVSLIFYTSLETNSHCSCSCCAICTDTLSHSSPHWAQKTHRKRMSETISDFSKCLTFSGRKS